VFFDGTNADGLPSPSGAIFSMFQTSDGTVYLGDGDTDTVYACKDLNNDGDALDLGEARIWFSGFNASLLPLPTPNGICQGADGAIYITNAGSTSSPQDGLFRTIDLNADGDANDLGEQGYFVDETAIGLSNPAPFQCALVGNLVHFIEPRGSSADVILIARDTDNSGSVDATELGTFFTAGGPVAAPTSFTCVSDGLSIFVHESSGSAVQEVWKLTDLDASGAIDQTDEGVSVWSETSLRAPATMSNSFDVALGPAALAIASNGTDLNDEIIVAKDLNADGDYNDPDGTIVFVQGAAGSSFPENIRAVLFYGTPCAADINNSGSVTVQDIFDFLGFYFANDLRADINGSGSVTVQDIFDYLSLYFAGC